MRLPKAGTIEIAPSVLSADFANLASEVQEITDAGAKIVHLDIMDGHFVPNITFGPPVIAKLRKYSDLCFDAHLMIAEPDKYVADFAKAGADHITVHIETTDEPVGLINKIHDLGCTAGITLNPATSLSTIEKVAPMCEMVLVMTVVPGFGGQSFMDDAAQKCIKLREIVGADVRIQVDGGVDPSTSPVVISYGADTLVAGSAVFGKNNRKEAIDAILSAHK